MGEIKTFQDQTQMGTFSQINLEDGKKILISLTQDEIAMLKVGFMGFPGVAIWKKDMFDFLDIIYPKNAGSKFANKSVLQTAVDLALPCQSIEEVEKVFNNIKKEDFV
jgi:hypothetical protein